MHNLKRILLATSIGVGIHVIAGRKQPSIIMLRAQKRNPCIRAPMAGVCIINPFKSQYLGYPRPHPLPLHRALNVIGRLDNHLNRYK